MESNKGESEEKGKNRKDKIEVEASVNEQERTEIDELDIRGMVRKVVDEFFKSDNMEKIKQGIGMLIEEQILVKM